MLQASSLFRLLGDDARLRQVLGNVVANAVQHTPETAAITVRVGTDGDDVLFVVTMGAPIRTPAVNLQTGSTPVTLDNGLFLQNVDIYVDTDPASTDGSSSCIPGRRVAFADGRTWKAAVVLTPQPDGDLRYREESRGRRVSAQGVLTSR